MVMFGLQGRPGASSWQASFNSWMPSRVDLNGVRKQQVDPVTPLRCLSHRTLELAVFSGRVSELKQPPSILPRLFWPLLAGKGLSGCLKFKEVSYGDTLRSPW